MFEIARRRRNGELRAAMVEYSMLAALIVLIGLGSVTVAGANMNPVFSNLVDWIATAR
jgi:Flp pilus assembly pilin Flp